LYNNNSTLNFKIQNHDLREIRTENKERSVIIQSDMC